MTTTLWIAISMYVVGWVSSTVWFWRDDLQNTLKEKDKVNAGDMWGSLIFSFVMTGLGWYIFTPAELVNAKKDWTGLAKKVAGEPRLTASEWEERNLVTERELGIASDR